MTKRSSIAILVMLGAAAIAGAQQAPATVPPPKPVSANAAPALTPPKKAPPPPSGAPTVAAQRIAAPLAVRAMKRESAPPDSVRPATTAKAVIRPLATKSPPPEPVTTAARIAAADRVAPARTVPIGATMLCKDGTYLTGAPSTGRCTNNGGVAAIFPAQPSSPAAKPQPQRKQP